jgi:hypothetical protein
MISAFITIINLLFVPARMIRQAYDIARLNYKSAPTGQETSNILQNQLFRINYIVLYRLVNFSNHTKELFS